ncbi:167_t:CDS:1 [Dentiscutata erythropus]|uniref:167_t:CDS:1 n=1 Tax=Dentiscutata erythropus TaxID=1348616 RepID=A0A9N9F3E7_9GLOM|nr:167_t:CDS:1 [Dentiscutata erythropus]
MYHKRSKIKKGWLLDDIAVSTTGLPVITPSAQPSATATSTDSNNTPVILIAATVTIILVVILAIGFYVYYRRLRKMRKFEKSSSMTEEDDKMNKRAEILQKLHNSEYVTKHDVLEHYIDPQFPPNREGLDSILLEFSSLAGGMKPPPTAALPPIPTNAQSPTTLLPIPTNAQSPAALLPIPTNSQSPTNRRRTFGDKRPTPPPVLTGLKTAHVRNNRTISQDLQNSNITNSTQDHLITTIIQPTPVYYSELTQSKLLRRSIFTSNVQISSSNSTSTSNTLSSSTETSISLFGWEDNIDRMSDSDNNTITSKWVDIVDSPTLPQHPSVLSVVTKKSSGYLVPQSWAKAPWNDEASNVQSETDQPISLVDKENNLNSLFTDLERILSE